VDGKNSMFIWIAILALLAWWLFSQAKKTVAKTTTAAAKAGGYGLGQGLVDEGVHALGSFFGGLFGNKSTSGAASKYTSSAAHSMPDDDLLEPDWDDDDLEV
jgi:hypothetical protein